jgi:molybdate transport system substrate-binding protein
MNFRRLAALALAGALAFSARAADLTVFAAASLSDVLTALAQTYEPASGDTLRFNFGASSQLALQIKEGAPADLFFSADEARMDALAQAGLILAGTRRSLLSNTLAIVVNADHGAAISAPADLAKSRIARLALAEPQTVPAGIYAKEWLRRAGLWAHVADRVIPTENVRACLAAVESGNADAGIVYKTDALISKKVKIAWEVPPAEGPRISYPLAVLKDSNHPAAARRFAAWLAQPEARALFEKYGFLPAP